MDRLEGGYIIHKAQPILAGRNKHTAEAEGRPVSEYDLEATNRLQATPWTINRRVLDVARTLFNSGISTPLIPGNALVGVPGRMEDGIWEGLGDADKKRHKVTIAKAHQENASRTGKRIGFLDALDTATDMESHPAFWFVWCHDFRLRRYPVACGGLSPQGNDLSKNLMMFAEGKPLGESGWYWLCVRLANAMGQDKLYPDERVEWVQARMQDWLGIVQDPIGCLPMWENADEPWCALATIFEIVDADLMDDPRAFISHLPVNMDGSCNGLQHLSALGLDEVGARETNLMPGERRDVYMAVAKHAISRVEMDAAKGLPEAMLWLGKADRNAVKRSVLATPYGVTDEGIRRQLVEDGKVPYSETVPQKDASAYFRDVLVEALSGTVVAAKQIMGWLQTCAQRLAEAGLPMIWETPTGSTIRQAYHEHTLRRVQTLVGRVNLLEEVVGGGLEARKQALGSAPNVVHSLDAAHLAATVNVLGRRYGITDFAMIHDSFGVHACDVPVMNAVLRSTFVEQYSGDNLQKLYEGFKSYAPHVDLPPPPARGDFDLEENVPHAVYFFA